MKTKYNLFIACLLLTMGQLFLGCQKQDTEECEVNFGIGVSNTTESSTLKCTPDYDLSTAKYIIITIKKADGSSTSYTSSQINIHKLNGSFYSQNILLKPGTYKLTEFIIADSLDNIIFVAPVTGSALSSIVTQALPIIFTVNINQSTMVPIDVISTEGFTYNDFGLVWFPIKEVINVHVAVVDKSTLESLAVKLYVYNDSYLKTFDIPADINNIFTVPDRYINYCFQISKTGYKEYLGQVSIDSLRKLASYSSDVPLLIKLEKCDTPPEGPVGYWPFNGNANDESGNGNNAFVYGATLTTDRKGNANKAYSFNGFSNWMKVENSISLNIHGNSSLTMCAWIKTIDPIPTQIILNKWGPKLEEDDQYSFAISNNKCGFTLSDEPTNITSISNITANNWEFIVGVFNHNAKLSKIYINGQLDNYKVLDFSIWDTEQYLEIGIQTCGYYFKGSLDDIRVYNRAINDEEIQALYHEMD